jgi:hypothetical protein
MRLFPEIPDMELVSVEARASTGADSRDLGRSVDDGIALHAGDEVVTVVQQRTDDLPCAVQGVGDHEGGLLQQGRDGEEELDELVEQRPLVTVGEDETFLDAAEQGDAGDVAQRALYQQPEGLERVPEDERGLGVVLGLLEQLLDRGHLSTLFGDLDAIGHEYEA